MPRIDYDDYSKNLYPNEGNSIKSLKPELTQHYSEKDEIIIDFITIDIGGNPPLAVVEVWMGMVGENLKKKVAVVPKEVFDTYNVLEYIDYLLKTFGEEIKNLSDGNDGDIIEFLLDPDEET